MNRLTVLAIAILMSACGPGSTPTGNVTSPTQSQPPTSSPSPQATPSPTTAGMCSATTRCLALVTLRGSNTVVVRDVTDFNHPKTVGSLGAVSTIGGYGETVTRFISATTITFLVNGRVVSSPLSGSPRTPVPGGAGGVGGGVWSPDRSAVVYTTVRGSVDTGDEKLDVHLLRAGADRVVGTTPGLGVGGCEYIASCTLPNWLDARLAFSPDGKYFSFVADGFGSSFFYLWASDGTLLNSSTAQFTTMSTWSGEQLFFRDSAGVEVWSGENTSEFLPRVAWIRPSASPAGGQIVYTVRGSGGWGHIYLVDTATHVARELKAQRTDAVFLTSRYIWYRGERACVAADECGDNPPFHPGNGKTYIYDLQTGTEYGSIITNVYDVWPHAA